MYKNIFPLFITFLGIITAYVFYAVWHTQEPTLANLTPSSPQTTITEDYTYIDNTIEEVSNSVDVKNKPKRATVVQASKENSIESHAFFVHQTPQEVEEQYEAMIPKSYDTTLTQAEVAFASIDVAVLEMQEYIDTPMVEMEQTE